MRMGLLRTLVAPLVALLAAGAQAAIVYDNGGPDASSGNDATQWVQAENFSIAAGASVMDAGVYIAGFDGIGNWDGAMDYYFFADVGGTPGALLASGAAQNMTTTDSGIAWCCGGNAYLIEFDLAAPFAAAAGTTYWFGIHASANFGERDDIYWVTTAPGAGNGHESDGGTFDNWFNNGQEHAFFLTGGEVTPMPEPMSLALVGIGLAGLAFRRRR